MTWEIIILIVLAGGVLMAKSWLDWQWSLSHVILKNIDRIKLWDTVLGYDLNTERKMLFSTVHNNNVDVAIFGCGSRTYAPFYDVIMELAYDRTSKNLNVVIMNKGDNALEISVDDVLIATTTQISQGEILFSDQPAIVQRKWVSFNFRSLKP